MVSFIFEEYVEYLELEGVGKFLEVFCEICIEFCYLFEEFCLLWMLFIVEDEFVLFIGEIMYTLSAGKFI